MFSNKIIPIFTSLFFVAVCKPVFASAPEIASVTGTFSEGQQIVITGKNFTAKKNPQPLLYWSADGGELPSSLGRKLAWDGKFSGEFVDLTTAGAVVADGSNAALRLNYNLNESAILARVHFDSDDLYVWRKRYDAFDRTKDAAVRLRYKALKPLSVAPALAPGMLVLSADKKYWGKIISVDAVGADTGSTNYLSTVGNISDDLALNSFTLNSQITFYAETDTAFKTPLFEAVDNEGQGIYKGFNHKIIRMWGSFGNSSNDTYISLDKDGVVVNESTQDATFWHSAWDNPINSATKKWVVEEFQYRTSTLNNIDGTLQYWQDGIIGWNNHAFRFITTAWPLKYSDLYQTQVSNGTQPNVYEYFDSLYVDDTWHRVLVCSESTLSMCKTPEVLIPTAWDDGKISVVVRKNSLLTKKTRFYYFVVNGLGEVNATGFVNPCPLCPVKVQ